MTRGEMERTRGLLDGMAAVIRDAVLVTAVFSMVGLFVNLAHPEAIPYLAQEEYEILVPCPVPGGEVSPLEASDPILHAEDTFLVDARPSSEFEAWRFRQAINLTFDYLDATPGEDLRRLAAAIARSRARRVVVYGDGRRPDTGEQLGKEISLHGIKNVFFVSGGAPRLRSTQQQGADP